MDGLVSLLDPMHRSTLEEQITLWAKAVPGSAGVVRSTIVRLDDRPYRAEFRLEADGKVSVLGLVEVELVALKPGPSEEERVAAIDGIERVLDVGRQQLRAKRRSFSDEQVAEMLKSPDR